MLVKNRHSAHVAGLAPGEVGDVSGDDLARWPWALSAVEIVDQIPEPPEDEEHLSAREARAAIAESDDPSFVRAFLTDGRASVQERAVARLRRITE